MKLTKRCLDDLGALLDLQAEIKSDDYSTRLALWDLRKDFRLTHGMDWATAKENADKYAREWRRRS